MFARRLVGPSLAACLAITSLLGGACAKEDPAARPSPTQAAPAPGAHAAPGVKPGSHEDWCEEHQVAESQCTRCSPDLVPAFKATGDWCPEHGVPESQCKLCNPGLVITRPPKGS